MAYQLSVSATNGVGASKHFGGGQFAVYIFAPAGGGDFDSATVKLQESPDGGSTFIDSKDRNGNAISSSSNDRFEALFPRNTYLRASTSGSNGQTVVSVQLSPLFTHVARVAGVSVSSE